MVSNLEVNIGEPEQLPMRRLNDPYFPMSLADVVAAIMMRNPERP
jgi:hypothetical protein